MNTPNKTVFRYAVYARRSSEHEDSQIQSIQRQMDELSYIVSRDKLATFEENICESKSAFHPGREGFAKLVELTMKGRVNAWLCWHPNRLSRNPVDSGAIIYLMDQGKLHHVRTHDRTYYNTPADKFNLQIDLGMSKRDSDDKSAIVRSGILRRHRRGYPNGFPPVGYVLRGQGSSGHSIWVPDPDRFKLVQRVFRRYLKGKDSLRTIRNYSIRIGLRTPARTNIGGLPLGRSSIKTHLLCNTIYAGFFHGSDGQRYELDPTLPRVITEGQLHRINQILGANTNRAVDEIVARPAAYRGLISGPRGEILGQDVKFQLICDCKRKFAYLNRTACPKCGAKIDNLSKPRYLKYTYYYSILDRRDPLRRASVVEEKRVDQFLKEKLAAPIRISPQLRDWAVKYLQFLEDAEISSMDKEWDNAEGFRTQYLEKRKRLRHLYLGGHITQEELDSDLKELDAVFDEKERLMRGLHNSKNEIEKILNLAVELHHVLESGDALAKNQAFRNSCSNLSWDGENLFISNTKRVNILIETLKSAKAKNPRFEPENCVDTSSRNKDFKVVCSVLCRGLNSIRT